MDGMGGAEQWSSPSSPSSHQKRPAGRTKFKETRHPVYRGVRRRGSAGRWVCEVRVPGKRGERLWLGTYVTAEAAARGHDAAMLALGGGSELCLNFADSARLLAVPSGLADLAAVRRAALAAVADFQRREAAYCAADEIDTSSASAPSSADNAGSSATSLPSALDELFELPAAAVLGSDMYDFELDMSGEMDPGSYYADFAEGMLLDPPPPHESTEACWDGGADYAALWSQY
ncbi:dehydration-responsive element-binding protein 1H-like [Lolium rigidum]|uniref:dehydration-responsive element-binding protein 1H-like n=1 Tax=Lolium rigidum TaxID=89674 RepID=UPI001F5E1E73|nr:dehydration-responsive element-binding protein 1H-like [Lolium rigidum]